MAWFDEFNLPGATIDGYFGFVVADGPDEDEAPDVVLANGWVTFTATTSAARVDGAWLGIEQVRAQIFEGRIVVSEEDPRPVRLLATDAPVGVADWAWKVSFDLRGFRLGDLTFKAPRDTTVNLTADLIPIRSMPYQIIEGASIYDAEQGTGEHEGLIRFLLTNGERTDWIDIPNGARGLPGEKGDDGRPGADGESPLISMGTVTAGTVADAWLTGPVLDRQLNLTLPRGERGLPGPPGPPGNGGANLDGLNGITALTQEEYDAITPDPLTLYVVTGGTPPVDPEEPDEPGEQGTLAAPSFGEPVYAGNNSATSSITIDRPADLRTGDLLVIALRSQEGSAPVGWTAPSGFVAAFNEPASWPVSSVRVAGVWVKPITDLGSEPSSYTFTGPTGRNVGVASRMNIGGLAVTKVATAPYGSVSWTVEEQVLDAAPALSLMVMGAECTSGISRVPSSIPAGFATIGNEQSSLDGSTSGSRTAVWLGWRYEADANVEELSGGFTGASAAGLYYGAITGGA